MQAAGLGGPAAVLQRRTVLACNPEARGFGVRRGMRVREAQALCTGLKTVEADVDCDARAFEPIVQGLDEVAASVEVLRPGLAVVALAGPARYFGGEPEAVERLLDAAARRGVDCLAGVADEIPTAVLAARRGAVVPPGCSPGFLAPLPLGELAAEVALGCDRETLAQLSGLGVRTAGELAALPASAVATRFGRAGMRCHELVCARGAQRSACCRRPGSGGGLGPGIAGDPGRPGGVCRPCPRRTAARPAARGGPGDAAA